MNAPASSASPRLPATVVFWGSQVLLGHGYPHTAHKSVAVSPVVHRSSLPIPKASLRPCHFQPNPPPPFTITILRVYSTGVLRGLDLIVRLPVPAATSASPHSTLHTPQYSHLSPRLPIDNSFSLTISTCLALAFNSHPLYNTTAHRFLPHSPVFSYSLPVLLPLAGPIYTPCSHLPTLRLEFGHPDLSTAANEPIDLPLRPLQ
ncbi:hypothetical protein BT63DRAFT_457999 [Microthyrium microscopicum]|uniref:Uncharacterized protein n=1 Tax=Microthyrium microscopicum TaxID=703497 RepID=A0A6A6U419_9PEZI|nr:hypothetical protein BT63DRAFT_457999 [Microthyrium microscopicum]